MNKIRHTYEFFGDVHLQAEVKINGVTVELDLTADVAVQFSEVEEFNPNEIHVYNLKVENEGIKCLMRLFSDEELRNIVFDEMQKNFDDFFKV